MCARSRGFTLIELIVLIVVIGAALAGVLLVFQNTVRASADPQVAKQAIAVAEGLLDEILLTAYDVGPGTGARASYDDVSDYHGYSSAGILDSQGAAVPGLGAYNVASVSVATQALAGVAEAKRVTVRVTGPQGIDVTLEGWRLRYAAP